MPRPSERQRRRLRARAMGITTSVDAFRWVAAHDDQRINILVEGDSWFAYPKDWLFFGENANVVHSIFSRLAGKDLVNTLCLASNGDTAQGMLTGTQLKYLRKTLKKFGKQLDLCLFSAGGNDVVGPDDLEPLILPFVAGMAAADCIHAANFADKLDDIEKHYRSLIKLRDTHAPGMKIICHTYDILQPSDKPAELLWGVEVSGPWILPTLQLRGVPQALHMPLVRELLQRFRQRLLDVQADVNNNFFVVDTQGTLRPGHAADWRNEIHPTTSGFNRISEKIYAQMRAQFPQLPLWR